MTKVSILFRILPDDASKKVERIREEIDFKSKEIGFDVVDTKIEEVAFGLKALHILVTVKEEGGYMERVEKTLSSTDNVGSVEVLEVTRL